jgi:Ni/Co efflux regulator RcnB
MKKLILAAAAASVLVAAPASAQTFGRNDGHSQVQRFEQSRDNGRRNVQTRQVQVRQGQTRQVEFRQLQSRQAQARRWRQGERFDSRYANNYRVIGNPSAYRLHQAPRGYRWVQSGNDAVLVALASGLIAAIAGNAF